MYGDHNGWLSEYWKKARHVQKSCQFDGVRMVALLSELLINNYMYSTVSMVLE